MKIKLTRITYISKSIVLDFAAQVRKS